MAKITLPKIREISDFLSATLGRDVIVTMSKSGLEPGQGIMAVFISNERHVVSALLMDLVLATCSGAAMVLLPAQSAIHAAKRNALTEEMQENVGEVMNISAQLFRTTSTMRVALGEYYLPDMPRPQGLDAFLARPLDRLDVEVEISGYAKGTMSLLATA